MQYELCFLLSSTFGYTNIFQLYLQRTIMTENEQKQSSISQLEITKARGLRGHRPCPVEATHSNDYSQLLNFLKRFLFELKLQFLLQ